MKERRKGRGKDLLTERKKLPGQIAALSAERKRLLDTMTEGDGMARRLAEERLQGIGDELGLCEARLATVERELATLDMSSLGARRSSMDSSVNAMGAGFHSSSMRLATGLSCSEKPTHHNTSRTRCTPPGWPLPPRETSVGLSTISAAGQPCAS